MSVATLDKLPGELYATILDTIEDPRERFHAALGLSRALPRSPVPIRYVYHSVYLTTSKMVLFLYQHLRCHGGRHSQQAQLVRSVVSEVWDPDGQILADLLGLLPHTRRLSLNVGTTVAPEHLEEVFKEPWPDLEEIEIIFKPYVQRATYYQFLKGAYFDKVLIHLAKWPASCRLRYLSILQTLPPSPTLFQSFAQPIVFFSLQPLTQIAHSPILTQLRHLRVQIPARPIAQFLSAQPPSNPERPESRSEAAENLSLIDLSNTHVTTHNLPGLFARFPNLTHLILDSAGLIPRVVTTEIPSVFAEVGRALAMSGISRAKERERLIKTYVEARRAVEMERIEELAEALTKSSITATKTSQKPPVSGKKGKGGRRGLATAKFSIREKQVPASVSDLSSNVFIPSPGSVPLEVLEKLRVVPPLIALRSLCITTVTSPTTVRMAEWQESFDQGWAEGIRVVLGARKRLEASRRNGFAILRRFGAVKERGGNQDEDQIAELRSLGEVNKEDMALLTADALALLEAPRVCFGGWEDDDRPAHVAGCGHELLSRRQEG